jgi:shikimate dehydrogenase
MRLFGLIGYPLTHSFSKKYFTEKFEREGLTDCRYELFPIKSVYDIKEIQKEHPNLEGLNVTIPYKQLVLKYLQSTEGIPEGIGACNCIKIEKEKLTGFNTDITGFEISLRQSLLPHHKRALVLGNGGAAAAVVYVLRKLGIQYDIVSRRIHDDSTLTYDDIDEQTITRSQLIINTTPLGTHPNIDNAPDIPYQFLTSHHYLFDLIYNPDKTKFLEKGEERGAIVKNGYEMLLIQAEESWKIWNS